MNIYVRNITELYQNKTDLTQMQPQNIIPILSLQFWYFLKIKYHQLFFSHIENVAYGLFYSA